MTGSFTNNNGRTILLVSAACAALIIIVIVVLAMAGRSSVSNKDFEAMEQRLQALEIQAGRFAVALEGMEEFSRQNALFQEFVNDSAKRETDLLFRISDIEAKLGLSSIPDVQTPAADPVPPAKQPPVESKTEAKPTPPPSAPAQTTANGYYTVVKDDTTYSISRKFGLTVDQLLEMNNLKSTKIFPGQALKVKP